jgi:hypothetical protein
MFCPATQDHHVAENLGFELEGTGKQLIEVNGIWEDHLRFCPNKQTVEKSIIERGRHENFYHNQHHLFGRKRHGRGQWLRPHMTRGFLILRLRTMYTVKIMQGNRNAAGISGLWDHINRKKEQYKGKMADYYGIEADWYKGHGTYMSHYEDVVLLIEFTVGSVHNLMPKNKIYLIDGHLERYVSAWKRDMTEALKKNGNGYFESIWKWHKNSNRIYWATLTSSERTIPIQRFFTGEEPWLIRLEEVLAKEIAQLGLVTEVNGGGAYRYQNGIYYPSDHFLEILRESGVKNDDRR